MIGWLLDTNVVAELANPHGTARVHVWAAAQDEQRLYLSILTLGEYEKGLHNLPEDSAIRPRIEGALATLETRFAGRLLPVSNAVVVIAVEELARLLPSTAPQQPLVAFLQGMGLGDVSIEREPDLGRDAAL